MCGARPTQMPHRRNALDDLLRQRGLTKPLSTDDRAIWGFADAAVRRYHDATADDPGLPQLSKVQLWEIRQRLYVMHGPLGPLGDLLAIEGVEDIHINGTRGGYLVFGDRREELPARFDSEEQLIELVRHYAERDVGIHTPGAGWTRSDCRGGGHVIAGRSPASVTLTSRRTASSVGELLAAARA